MRNEQWLIMLNSVFSPLAWNEAGGGAVGLVQAQTPKQCLRAATTKSVVLACSPLPSCSCVFANFFTSGDQLSTRL